MRQNLKDYIRKKAFDKLITIYSRNQSLGDCMDELIRLTIVLNSLGINYNQVGKKKYTLDLIYQIKNSLIPPDQTTTLWIVKNV